MDRLEQLKTKYARALSVITETGVSLQNLHVQDDKLFLKGRAPSEQAKAEVWTAIKAIDPNNGNDLVADITIDSSLPTPPRAQSYTVKSGDSLSRIAKEFYGDAGKYMKIFEANRDQLSDPDKIKVGQVLKIPAA
jgi:nucleoid-associated protein YgaU